MATPEPASRQPHPRTCGAPHDREEPALDLIDAISPLSPAWTVGLVAASFMTSAITAAFGIGGGVTLLALMGIAMPGAVLIPVHGAVQVGSNAGRAWRARGEVAWPVALPFAAGAVVGAFAAAPLVIELPEAWFRIALGLFVLAITFLPVPGMGAPGRAGYALGGAVTSFLSVFFGATGPLVISALSRSLPERMRLVATTAMCMTSQHALKVLAFGALGFSFADWAPLVALMIATGYAGTVAGLGLLARIPESRFRLAFKVLVTVLALDLIRRGVAGL